MLSGYGRNRTCDVSVVGDLQSLALAARYTHPYSDLNSYSYRIVFETIVSTNFTTTVEKCHLKYYLINKRL